MAGSLTSTLTSHPARVIPLLFFCARTFVCVLFLPLGSSSPHIFTLFSPPLHCAASQHCAGLLEREKREPVLV